MEREVSSHKFQQQGEGDTVTVDLLEEQVIIATDKLLLTNFQECFDICRHIVSAVKSQVDRDAENVERLERIEEAATVVGIQALAEQGAWRNVIPFVQQVYTHIASCPSQIMQMCLLLHAHVREYLVCHSLVNEWLSWDDHANQPSSKAIVALYVTNVLVPLKAFNLIPQVVERCAALSSEERQHLLSPSTWSHPHTDPSESTPQSTSAPGTISSYSSGFLPSGTPASKSSHGSSLSESPRTFPSESPRTLLSKTTDFSFLESGDVSSMDTESCGLNREDDDSSAGLFHRPPPLPGKEQITASGDNSDRPHVIRRLVSLYLDLSRRLLRKLAKYGWCQKLRKVSKLVFLVSFVLLAILHVQTDVTTNFNRAMELWRGAVRSLGSLLKWQPKQLAASS